MSRDDRAQASQIMWARSQNGFAKRRSFLHIFGPAPHRHPSRTPNPLIQNAFDVSGLLIALNFAKLSLYLET